MRAPGLPLQGSTRKYGDPARLGKPKPDHQRQRLGTDLRSIGTGIRHIAYVTSKLVLNGFSPVVS